MTRTAAREIAVRFCFELDFAGQSPEEFLSQAMTQQMFDSLKEEDSLYMEFPDQIQQTYISTLVKGVYHHEPELDEYISKYAISWKFSRLNRVIVAIMRVAMYEILYMQDVPNGAAINEAVELTKRYEEPEAAAFVNGILGTFVRKESIPDPVWIREKAPSESVNHSEEPS